MAQTSMRNRRMLSRWMTNSAVLFFALLLLASTSHAGQATLTWDANPDPAVAGYMVYSGEVSGSYTSKVDAGNRTTATVNGLKDGVTYYHAVTAYDASRAESGFSAEVSGVAKPSAVAAPSAVQSSGGGGGCALGTPGQFDPLPLLLLLIAAYFVGRQRDNPRQSARLFSGALHPPLATSRSSDAPRRLNDAVRAPGRTDTFRKAA